MSADNGIYILVTKRTRTQKNGVVYNDGKEHLVYRVAHAAAIDNFDWYKEHQIYNFGAYMKDVWGKSEIYETEADALKAANQLKKEYHYVEYGICTIDASDVVFYGDS